MAKLTFDDILKMGWEKGYDLLHNIVAQDIEYQSRKEEWFFYSKFHKKKQLIERAKE